METKTDFSRPTMASHDVLLGRIREVAALDNLSDLEQGPISALFGHLTFRAQDAIPGKHYDEVCDAVFGVGLKLAEGSMVPTEVTDFLLAQMGEKAIRQRLEGSDYQLSHLCPICGKLDDLGGHPLSMLVIISANKEAQQSVVSGLRRLSREKIFDLLMDPLIAGLGVRHGNAPFGGPNLFDDLFGGNGRHGRIVLRL